jgi:aspartate-semialdehyde dehydrogenase
LRAVSLAATAAHSIAVFVFFARNVAVKEVAALVIEAASGVALVVRIA